MSLGERTVGEEIDKSVTQHLEKLRSNGEIPQIAEYLESPRQDEDGRTLLPEQEPFTKFSALERYLENSEPYSCDLEFIDKYPQSSWEDIFLRDGEGNMVVETADKKGHAVRNMYVYGEHGVFPDKNDVRDVGLEELFDISAEQIQKNQDVSDNILLILGLTTEPCHYHVIASDLEGYFGVKDLEEVNNYALWDLSEDYSFEDPEEVHYGDARGKIGLEPYIS